MIFADTPRWENHGTLWGHLISDSSLEELHAAAARAGIHPRAFDLDHYDWPIELMDNLRAAGVTFVDSGTIARTLRSSGLRVSMRERPALRRQRTNHVLHTLGIPGPWEGTIAGGGYAHIRVLDIVWGPLSHAESSLAGVVHDHEQPLSTVSHSTASYSTVSHTTASYSTELVRISQEKGQRPYAAVIAGAFDDDSFRSRGSVQANPAKAVTECPGASGRAVSGRPRLDGSVFIAAGMQFLLELDAAARRTNGPLLPPVFRAAHGGRPLAFEGQVLVEVRLAGEQGEGR